MKVEIVEKEKIGMCPSGHRSFYLIKDGGLLFCMVCYALGFVKKHKYAKVENFVVNTLYGKQIDEVKIQAQLKN